MSCPFVSRGGGPPSSEVFDEEEDITPPPTLDVRRSQFVDFLENSVFQSYQLPKFSSPNPYDSDYLQQFRFRADPLADQVFVLLKEQAGGHFSEDFDLLHEIEKKSKEAEEAKDENDPFLRFWRTVNKLPDWYDHEKVEKAKVFFVTAGFPGGAFSLTAASLTSSYGAAYGSQVLTETGRLNDDVVKRIYETGVFLYSVMVPNSLLPGNRGWKIVLQVRLLHCAIRLYLQTRQKKWDEKVYGVPINQEDLAGTICLFGPVLLESMKKLNYTISKETEENHMILWRTVGHFIGIEPELLPENYQQTLDYMDAVRKHQWNPSPASLNLVRSLYKSLHLRPRYFFLPARFWNELSRYLLGDQPANLMQISKPTLFWSVVIFLLRLFVILQCFLHTRIPFCARLNCSVNWFYWDFNINRSVGGRSVDFKLKQY